MDPVVVGRYAGTVAVLADLLRGAGIPVAATGAVDGGGVQAVRRAIACARGAVVLTLGRDDPTLSMALAACDPGAVVAVTWHPPDERPALPAGVRVVAAGRILADLAATVRAVTHAPGGTDL